nr:DUF1491 family protein [uncultured Sphingomonas sp.]
MDRLPARLEVDSLIRRAETALGFGMVLQKGDPDRGQIILIIQQRGVEIAVMERSLDLSGAYLWQANQKLIDGGREELAQWVAKRRKYDPDLWLIELDVPDAQRFIAETTLIG